MEDSHHPFESTDSSPFPEIAPRARRAAPVVAVVLLCAAGFGLAIREHHNALSLAAQNQQMVAQLNATHSQLDALVARVNALATSAAANPASTPTPEAKPSPAIRAGRSAGALHAAARRSRAQDQRFNKMQSQLDEQNKAIEDTRNDLASARTELNGSIARTHDELVVLEKKGERNYVEFDIQKSKEFKREGPLSVKLKKANVKNQYADLQLIVDDRTLTQKHVNLYQPAMFYQPDTQQPIEIVINEISKDHVHGYISSPKYRQSELAAMSNPENGQDQTNSQPARQRLPLPADNAPVQQ